MLRKIRITAAVICFTCVTLLFLDFTGTLHQWFGWSAKTQFFPALLALHIGVVVGLILLTLLFGRIYCSVICPLGVFQDSVSWTAGKRKKNRFRYSPALNGLRYGVLALFVFALIGGGLLGTSMLVSLLEPYSAYGRMASNLLAPLYQWSNNGLAYLAERMDSYAFYSVDVWIKSMTTFVIAVVTLIVIVILSWRGGRTYCNTLCPVGTLLGFLSRFSLCKPVFDTARCNSCGLCARNCKASCIDSGTHTIDYSRCVTCMDCINKCNKQAIHYKIVRKQPQPVIAPATAEADHTTSTAEVNAPSAIPGKKALKNQSSRRDFLSVTALFAVTTALKAQEKKVDGGLAVIEQKKRPTRAQYITPPGSKSVRNLNKRCTACQLCVSVCPNQILFPSADLTRLMQPEISYERGFCRPECNRCSQVCPAGAIEPLDLADKSATQIGRAVWIRENCLPCNEDVRCSSCAIHCPTGAIQMVPKSADDPESTPIPVVHTERCIGCGACEHYCPARPFSAIYVEGNTLHRTI
ncbi:MAG: 4Fe-4S binding protein [Bacteroides sp.]|nr:4Fe-4S binding protein [Bacteroides sp.]